MGCIKLIIFHPSQLGCSIFDLKLAIMGLANPAAVQIRKIAFRVQAFLSLGI
jgi:hypothetical protein